MKIIAFIIYLLIVSSKILFSQIELQTQYTKADSLYIKEDYFDAITEFKRLLFFDEDGIYTFKANEMIGKCYKEGAKFSDAILYFNYAELAAKNPEETYDSRLDIIKVNILRRSTSNAIRLLDSLSDDSRFKNKKDDIYYWKGWAYIFADDWESASKEFAKINENHPLKILADKVISERYSVTEAQILSGIIPGAGQIYTGHVISGLLSLGWNVLWGYLTVNSIIQHRVLDGLLVGDLLWFRFYRGNLQNAGKFVDEANIAVSNKALNYLQFQYKGEKP
jgi:tetratricopeptide (TPR) repeat protein